MSVNQAPRGKQQIAITQELVQRIAALVGGGGGVGLFPAQNDILAFPDDSDASFPYRFDFVLPSNFQKMISARLSWKLRNYRTYNTFTVSTTGATTPAADGAGGETGHSHNHAHTIPITFQAGIGSADTVFWQGSGNPLQTTGSGPASGNTSAINSDATGSSGHNHGTHTHGSHTHTISGSSFLGITEDTPPLNPGITVAIDGTDFTAALGGPFQTDVIELDIRPYLPKSTGVFHTLTLQPNQRCRIHGILRLSYNVQPGLS